MSQPRISAYASSADGNALPTRVIQGPDTHQARTSHYLAVDSVHDELIVPNPFADALLIFTGGAKGDAPPIRIIQGPKTMMVAPDNVAVDPIHKEIFNASFPTDSIIVFNSEANGDVAPIRIIHGPKTRLDRPIRVEADGENSIIAVLCDHELLIFDSKANGDVAPKWVLAGDKVGIGASFGTRAVRLYAKGKKIIAGGGTPLPGAQAGGRGGRGGQAAAGGDAAGGQAGGGGRGAGTGGDEEGGGRGRGMDRFLGVWAYGDNGNVNPLIKVHGPGGAAAINPDDGDVISGGAGIINFFHVPEIFK